MSVDSPTIALARAETRAREIVLPWLLLAFGWLAATAWARPLMLPDEGRYVGVAWEMLRSGNWLTPMLNGMPFFHKPPLFYWITAASMALFGPNAWAARAAPLFGASVGAAALFLFTRRWADPRTARLALLALLAQPLFFLGAQFANLDMLVAGLIGATVLLLADAVLRLEGGLPHRRSLMAAYATAALGVLAKGLIGFVIPALVIVVGLAFTRRLRWLARLPSLPGALGFLLVASPWFVAMAREHPGFLHYFFVEQHFKRFAAGGFNNVQPFWFYPALIGLFCLPWWPWLLRLARTPSPDASPRHVVRVLMVAWAAVTLLFFSLPASKLIGYVLPAVPPLAYLAADGLVAGRGVDTRPRRWWWIGNAMLAMIGLAAVIVLTLRPPLTGRDVAAALARQRTAGEPVVMLERYVYDLPFYARLVDPVMVVDRWNDPDIAGHDNWKKELADAATFAAPAAAARLVPVDRLGQTLCAAPVTWVIGGPGAVQRYPLLASARPITAPANVALWRFERVDASGLNPLCLGRPNAGSPGT